MRHKQGTGFSLFSIRHPEVLRRISGWVKAFAYPSKSHQPTRDASEYLSMTGRDIQYHHNYRKTRIALAAAITISSLAGPALADPKPTALADQPGMVTGEEI